MRQAHLDSLAEALDMRRYEVPGLVAGHAEGFGELECDRAFAVGASNVDRLEIAVWVVQK